MANTNASFNPVHSFGPDNLGCRIFAQGAAVSNDTWTTHLNNNDLVVGPTGSGKTRNYVKPNLLQCNESVIVTDTKGNLVREVGPVLAAHGYRVLHIDFTDMGASFGYNPLDFIREDERTGRINDQDVNTVARALCPVENSKEPFWDYAAQMYLSALVSFVVERLPEYQQTLTSVGEMVGQIANGRVDALMQQLQKDDPESRALKKYRMFCSMATAEKMNASIIGIMAEKLDALLFDGADSMYKKRDRIDFRTLGVEKTALFLTVSDTDRSMDRLVNLFYTQALQTLCDFADDDCPRSALPTPVRLYLDDFATNCVIPDFDKIISVIRSRNISVSVVLQSLTQLESMYGKARADTIVNGCDHLLYLGGRDLQTAGYISCMADVPRSRVLGMPLDRAYLVETGSEAHLVRKYRLEEHPRYQELPEVTGWIWELENELDSQAGGWANDDVPF